MEGIDRWLGTWIGEGSGVCPGGRGVAYDERFTLVLRDRHVHYHQLAVERSTGFVFHEESAVLRDGVCSLVMSSGRMELGTVAIEGDALVMAATRFHNDHKGVRGVRRTFRVDGTRLHKELWLATPVWPELTRHMHGTLERVEPER